MVGVVYYLDRRGWLKDQWEYVLSNFGPDNVWIITNEENPHHNYGATFINTLDELPNEKIVILAPQQGRFIKGQTNLIDYVHPQNAIYVFGPDNLHLNQEHLGTMNPDDCDVVYIPTVASEIYSFMAGAVVLYDRLMKNG